MALIGAHISVRGGLSKAIDRGKSLSCEAIQIFTKNQLQWKSSPIKLEESMAFYKKWQESDIKEIVAHGSYLINLASEGDLRVKSICATVEELKRCNELGISSLVLHPGSHGGAGVDVGIKRVAQALKEVLERTEELKTRVLLETTAGEGFSLGGDLAHFGEIMELLDGHFRIGLCLDTCHLFASGYELSSLEGYERLILMVGKYVGLERVGCWHLNDSRFERGSRKDRHAHIGDGKIGIDAFANILTDRRWERVPCLLETPKEGRGDEGNLALLRKLRGH